jgi:hypothetical protein
VNLVRDVGYVCLNYGGQMGCQWDVKWDVKVRMSIEWMLTMSIECLSACIFQSSDVRFNLNLS